MDLARTPSPRRSAPNNVLVAVVAVLLTVISLARGFPLEGRELDSAVEGVQKYLESSGFPKMTRGEVMDFLNDFSRNSRVSRSDSGKRDDNSPQSSPLVDDTGATTTAKIPKDESPLNYGYPMSMRQQDKDTAAPSTTPMIFVTAVPADGRNDSQNVGGEKKPQQQLSLADVLRNAASPEKSIVPPADLNAYSKFKKIPEARNLKIDDEMKDFLGGFGLLDGAAPKPSAGDDAKPPAEAQRRNGDGGDAVTVDQKLLETILAETGVGRPVNVSRSLQPFLDSVTNRADHVFNPSDSRVKTVDVNRIAKIVENIRLLSEDNSTITLPQDVFQEKLENITAAIAAIDQPTDDNKVFNDGYEVFFDDNSKEIDSDLPDSPAAVAVESLDDVRNPPDPLSTDELQQLFEKNKNDVKRQEPVADTTVADDVASSSTEQQTVSTVITTTTTMTTTMTTSTTPPPPSSARTTTTSTSTDSSSEASSTVEVTSDASAARVMTTTVADNANPSLSQLAESFGGNDASSELQQAEVTDTPSNRPKNGLYFYVDWNSFLTVNQGQKNQVNLRFAPKAGNPAHFLRVTVP